MIQNCFHCKESIPEDENYMVVTSKLFGKAGGLFFHKACFNSLAGDEWMKLLSTEDSELQTCIACKEKQRAKGLLCVACNLSAPMCDLCGVQMVLRKPKNPAGPITQVFWGCSCFPQCKKTKRF